MAWETLFAHMLFALYINIGIFSAVTVYQFGALFHPSLRPDDWSTHRLRIAHRLAWLTLYAAMLSTEYVFLFGAVAAAAYTTGTVSAFLLYLSTLLAAITVFTFIVPLAVCGAGLIHRKPYDPLENDMDYIRRDLCRSIPEMFEYASLFTIAGMGHQLIYGRREKRSV